MLEDRIAFTKEGAEIWANLRDPDRAQTSFSTQESAENDRWVITDWSGRSEIRGAWLGQSAPLILANPPPLLPPAVLAWQKRNDLGIEIAGRNFLRGAFKHTLAGSNPS